LVLLEFIETLLPSDTHSFFSDIFLDIQSKPRGGKRKEHANCSC
jgi:hypothetical protein